MDGDIVIYQFSRSKILRGDFRQFLREFGFDKLPTGRRLRGMMNSFVFCVVGWDDDPREIATIPRYGISTRPSTRRGPTGYTFATSTWTS